MRKALLVLPVLALALAGPAFAADTTVAVTQNGDGGWAFNADPAYTTPYDLSGDSLYVPPISTDPADATDKFIGLLTPNTPTAELTSISYDFKLVDNAATPGASDDFYVNIYTKRLGSPATAWYDCRYDIVPAAGSGSTADFVTMSATAGEFELMAKHNDVVACPAFDALPEGSTVSRIVLNVGQSTASDAGVGGWIDDMVVGSTTGTTTYDFGRVYTKADCKDGGWSSSFAEGQFANQGDCVSSFASSGKQKG